MVRARDPDVTGSVVRDGVTLGYEVFGSEHADSGPTILLLPTWTIIHSRFWKFQVPDLSRRHRVLVYDGPGNGASDRVTDPERYSMRAYADDAAAVMAACDVERVVAVGLSLGARYALELADVRPESVAGLVLIGGSLSLGVSLPHRLAVADQFLDPAPQSPSGWDRWNLDYWHRNYREFTEWFFAEAFNEPHSTKHREDAVEWAACTGPTVLEADSRRPQPQRRAADILSEVACPVLLVHGDADRMAAHGASVEAARLSGGSLVTFAGSGHIPNLRDPIRFNLLVHEFLEQVA